MNIESSSKTWAVIFAVLVLGIVGYFGYKFYFHREEEIVFEKTTEPTPTPAPFRWDKYLGGDEATKSGEVEITTKGGVAEKGASTTKEVSVTEPATTKKETTVTVTTSTSENGQKTTETKTYSTTDENWSIEVKAEAHAESSSSSN